MRSAMIVALLVTALGLAACETYEEGMEPGPAAYRYVGQDYQRLGNHCAVFGGPGAPMLDPWLACTREGQDLVRYRYGPRSGNLSPAMADRLNIWFRRNADTNHDLRLTDPEIKAALVNAVLWQRHLGWRG
jgi:hypothetical protein